jgi:hypothetical protein
MLPDFQFYSKGKALPGRRVAPPGITFGHLGYRDRIFSYFDDPAPAAAVFQVTEFQEQSFG